MRFRLGAEQTEQAVERWPRSTQPGEGSSPALFAQDASAGAVWPELGSKETARSAAANSAAARSNSLGVDAAS